MTVLMTSSGTSGLFPTIGSSVILELLQLAVDPAVRVVRTSESYAAALPFVDMHRPVAIRADRLAGDPLPCAVQRELTSADQALKALFVMPGSAVAINRVRPAGRALNDGGLGGGGRCRDDLCIRASGLLHNGPVIRWNCAYHLAAEHRLRQEGYRIVMNGLNSCGEVSFAPELSFAAES